MISRAVSYPCDDCRHVVSLRVTDKRNNIDDFLICENCYRVYILVDNETEKSGRIRCKWTLFSHDAESQNLPNKNGLIAHWLTPVVEELTNWNWGRG